jgi:hypothetical protein
VLERYQENTQNNPEILSALVSFFRKAGDAAQADRYEQRLLLLQGPDK